MIKALLIVVVLLFCFSGCEKVNLNCGPGGIDQYNIKITYWLHHQRDALSFTFDDDNKAHGDIAGLLDKYNFKGSFFVNPGLSGFSSMKEMYKNMYERGHEIGNHTLDHYDLPKLDTTAMKVEIQNGAKMIEEELGVYPVSFVHPYNDANNLVNQFVFRYHLVSRIASPYSLKNRVVFDISSTWPTLEKVKSVVSNLSKKNYWIIFAGHGYGGTDVTWEYLQGICDLVSENPDIWVDKLSVIGAYDYLRRELKVKSTINANMLTINIEGFNSVKFYRMQILPLTIAIPYLSDIYKLTPTNPEIETEYGHNICYLTFDFRKYQTLSLKFVKLAN